MAFCKALLQWTPLFACAFLAIHSAAVGQAPDPSSETKLDIRTLDPTRSLGEPQLQSSRHRPLDEEYIWTREDAVTEDGKSPGDWLSGQQREVGHHYFRRSFQLDQAPKTATLYVAGPRWGRVYLNGRLVQSFEANLDSALGIRVFSADLGDALRKGRNVIAMEVVRGPSIGSGADSRRSLQQTSGKVLVVKIVPAALGVIAPPLLISDKTWKASLEAKEGWQQDSFDDQSWQAADSLGGIESSIEFFQWNADAGLYNWPGYDGISPFLAQYELAPVLVSHVYAGLGTFTHPEALTQQGIVPQADEFRVQLTQGAVDLATAPQVLLDFGREVDGRLALVSDSELPSEVAVQYGESVPELFKTPYLGVTSLHLAPHTAAFGPKSAFRYALVRFTAGADIRYKSIHLAGINYPVTYKGSFESSDDKLNKMWAIGAYTAHLCMQDDIWDAPKRDRGRWMGDLDVSGRTIEDAFDDHFLMEETLDRLLGKAPVARHVNGIAGYSALWVTGEAEYYRHTGSKEQLDKIHDRLVELLHYMETELDTESLYANHTQSWPFVDWSPELNGDRPEARRATEFEFYAAFSEGAYLLRELQDTANAELFESRAQKVKAAAQQHLLDPSGSFGPRWQTNAYAVLSGVATPAQYDAIWKGSLATVGHVDYNGLIITPYYNYYVISAMARMGHRADALAWIRQYWGGMLSEGATSFWEGYDPSWYKDDWHGSLQADNTSGYRVSLAHGWSTGVTPWLMEEVLGIKARAQGISQVDIRPDLIDLAWAKGGEPTPRGMLNVSISKSGAMETTIDLPSGTTAHLSMPVTGKQTQLTVNGKREQGVSAENGTRAVVVLSAAGHYVVRSE